MERAFYEIFKLQNTRLLSSFIAAIFSNCPGPAGGGGGGGGSIQLLYQQSLTMY